MTPFLLTIPDFVKSIVAKKDGTLALNSKCFNMTPFFAHKAPNSLSRFAQIEHHINLLSTP
jgi:hypothetical protein